MHRNVSDADFSSPSPSSLQSVHFVWNQAEDKKKKEQAAFVRILQNLAVVWLGLGTAEFVV